MYKKVLLIIAIIGIFFFGKNKVIDWAKTIAQTKKEFSNTQKEISTKKTIN